MKKYLVTYEIQESVYDPPYDQFDKGGYSKVTVEKYKFLDSLDDLYKYSKYSNVKYFEVARELVPTFEVKTIVTI